MWTLGLEFESLNASVGPASGLVLELFRIVFNGDDG